MGDRFNRSWVVAKESWAVLRGNPTLGVFPVISAIFTIIASIPFVVAIAVSSGFQTQHNNYQAHFTLLQYVLTFAMYFVNYVIVIFFNSALVACAHANLQGQPASVMYGIQQAARRTPQIMGWAAIAASVGTVLRAISERVGIVGAIVTSLIGLVWNVAVFFVVPLLVIEGKSPVAALRESTAMLKQSWGERIILGVGMGAVTGLLVILGFVPIFGSIPLFISNAIIPGLMLIGVSAIYFLLLAVTLSSLNMIFQTALFMYCRTGQAPAGFSAESVQYAFVEKQKRGIFGS